MVKSRPLQTYNSETNAKEIARMNVENFLKTRSKVHHRSETIDIMSIASFFYWSFFCKDQASIVYTEHTDPILFHKKVLENNYIVYKVGIIELEYVESNYLLLWWKISVNM